MTDGPGVLILTDGPQTGCEWWRCHMPARYLVAQGYPVYLAAGLATVPRDRYQVIVLPRFTCTADQLALRARWITEELHAAGFVVLGEYDDDGWTEAAWPQAQVLHPTWGAAEFDQELTNNRRALALLDGVTVSTPALAAVAEQYTRAPVEVVPNAIDWAPWQAACRLGQRPAPGLTVGWAGGQRTADDVALLAEAWARLAVRHPAVTFVVAGTPPAALAAAVPANRLVQVPWHGLPYYPRAYHGLDIACAPLAETPFNRCKSPCKAFEYAAAGSAIVASPTVYGRVLRPGIDGYIARTADEWESMLAALIESAPLRQRMAASWAARVQARHSLASEAWRWPTAWARLARRARVKVA